jgi:hypothetical protein
MPYIPEDDRKELNLIICELAQAIAKTSAKHQYEAAFAGQLNYTLTRLIQELPRALASRGCINEEMRYWTQPLLYGVLLDVVLEHKRRVNVAYEAAQIIKSGDCYDTPYYTRLIEVVDKEGNIVGYQEVMVKKSNDTLNKNHIGRIQLD